MSDSPKYCAAQLRVEQERRLRQERERQAAVERARREAEQERRRRERLEQDRKGARHHLNQVQQVLSTLSSTDLVRFVPAKGLRALENRLRAAEDAIRDASSDKNLRDATASLQAIQDELRLLAAEAETAKLCEDLATEEAMLVRIQQQLVASDRARSEKFDRAGLLEVTDHLHQARSHLQKKALEQARRETSETQRCLERHNAAVADRFSRWQKAKARAEVAVASVRDRIAGLRADPVVVRWVSGELEAIEQKLASVARLIPEEEFDQAADDSARLQETAETILAGAGEIQLKEDRRQYIVTGIVEVMRQMNFVVQQGYPGLEHPDVPTSATIIQAVRVGGGALAVSVPQEGQIWYDVAGFPMRMETASDGRAVHSCDEAEEEIERMHQEMKEAFGIEMSELTWDTKDPDRVRKAAKKRPEDAPATRKRGS